MNVNVYQNNDEGSSYDFCFGVVDSDTRLSSMLRYSVSSQQAKGIYEKLAQWFGKKDEPETGEQTEQKEPRIRGVYVTADRSIFLRFDSDGDWSKCLWQKWRERFTYVDWEDVVSELPASAFPLTLTKFHHEYDEPDNRCAYFLGNGKIITPGPEGFWHIGEGTFNWDGILMCTSPSDFPLRKAVPEAVES